MKIMENFDHRDVFENQVVICGTNIGLITKTERGNDMSLLPLFQDGGTTNIDLDMMTSENVVLMSLEEAGNIFKDIIATLPETPIFPKAVK